MKSNGLLLVIILNISKIMNLFKVVFNIKRVIDKILN